RMLATPAGGLPAALWLLGLIGLAWGHAPIAERLSGFSAFLRLLAIPLLLVQFRRSEHGMQVAAGFLAGCIALLLCSWATRFYPGIWWTEPWPGVPVKDYVIQSGEFMLCTFACGYLAVLLWQQHRRLLALALALLALAFFANIVFVATARATLIAAV